MSVCKALTCLAGGSGRCVNRHRQHDNRAHANRQIRVPVPRLGRGSSSNALYHGYHWFSLLWHVSSCPVRHRSHVWAIHLGCSWCCSWWCHPGLLHHAYTALCPMHVLHCASRMYSTVHHAHTALCTMHVQQAASCLGCHQSASL